MAGRNFDEEIYDAMMRTGPREPGMTNSPRLNRGKTMTNDPAQELQALGMSGVGGIAQRGDMPLEQAAMINNGTAPQTTNEADIIRTILNHMTGAGYRNGPR
jgi:hypothetical protein